jgi:hypothetical protein
MRFLDRAWVDGERTDFEMQLHEQVYLRHLAAISDDLPRRLRVFAQVTAGTGLHKARLIKARLNRAKGTLRVVMQLPTAHEIWAKVRMQFSKVDIEAFNARPWKRVCSNPESTCLVDEVDLAPGGLYEHRMLFDPEGETSVIFKRFIMEIEELPDQHLEPHGGWREDK